MGYLSTSIKELTDKLNVIAEKLETETDKDEIMTLRFQAGVTMEIIKKLIMGQPIAKYCTEDMQTYLLSSDGTKELIKNKK